MESRIWIIRRNTANTSLLGKTKEGRRAVSMKNLEKLTILHSNDMHGDFLAGVPDLTKNWWEESHSFPVMSIWSGSRKKMCSMRLREICFVVRLLIRNIRGWSTTSIEEFVGSRCGHDRQSRSRLWFVAPLFFREMCKFQLSMQLSEHPHTAGACSSLSYLEELMKIFREESSRYLPHRLKRRTDRFLKILYAVQKWEISAMPIMRLILILPYF